MVWTEDSVLEDPSNCLVQAEDCDDETAGCYHYLDRMVVSGSVVVVVLVAWPSMIGGASFVFGDLRGR